MCHNSFADHDIEQSVTDVLGEFKPCRGLQLCRQLYMSRCLCAAERKSERKQRRKQSADSHVSAAKRQKTVHCNASLKSGALLTPRQNVYECMQQFISSAKEIM